MRPHVDLDWDIEGSSQRKEFLGTKNFIRQDSHPSQSAYRIEYSAQEWAGKYDRQISIILKEYGSVDRTFQEAMDSRKYCRLWFQKKIKLTSSDEFQGDSVRRTEEALSWNSKTTATYWTQKPGSKQYPPVKWPS